MILTCPNCGTQYVVKDDAIPPEGRQVRCAACKHSWHQDAALAAELTPAGEIEPAEEAQSSPKTAPAGDTVQPADEESFAEATNIEPRSGPEAEERAYEEARLEGGEEPPTAGAAATADEPASPIDANNQSDIARPEPPAAAPQEEWAAPPEPEAQVDEFTPYAAPDELEPRRRSPLLAIFLVIVIIIAGAAAFWFLAPPQLKARLGLAEVTSSPLALVTTHMDRQRLESGNELLTVTGRVINPTAREQDVPPLRAQLKTRAGKVVYSWTIAPPARSLAPGASASFNSAEVNVPPGGDELTITLGAEAG